MRGESSINEIIDDMGAFLKLHGQYFGGKKGEFKQFNSHFILDVII
jgi:hypothetical protein